MRSPFDALDGNHDGKVSRDEVMKHFSAIDANNDGDVTREEFMRQMMQSRGNPGLDARGPQGPMGGRPGFVPPFAGGRPSAGDARPDGDRRRPDAPAADAAARRPVPAAEDKKADDKPAADKPKDGDKKD